MKSISKVLLLLIVVTMLSISCASKDSTITIKWWQFPTFGTDGNFERTLINAFVEKNPDVIVELEMISFSDGPEKIEAALASNTGPDITYDSPGRIIDWGLKDVLVPLNDLIEPVQSTLAKGPLAAAKGSDGNYYMYPVHSGGFSMAFNKNLLEDVGVLHMLPYERDDRSWTVEEYENLLRALNEKLPEGKVPAVFYAKSPAGDQGTRAFMVNLYGNAPLMNENLTMYTYEGDNAIKNVEWLQMAVREGLILNGQALQSDDAIDMYCASNAASTILFSLQLEKINADKLNYNGEKFESIYMPFPNNSGDPILEFIVGGPAIFDNKDQKKIEAAKRFVAFIAQDEIYAPLLIEETGLFPVSNAISIDLRTTEEVWNAEAVKFFGAYYNTIPSFPPMREYWVSAMQSALRGENAQETLRNFVAQANATQ